MNNENEPHLHLEEAGPRSFARSASSSSLVERPCYESGLFRLWIVATAFWWALLGAWAVLMALDGGYFDGPDKAEWMVGLVALGLGVPALVLAFGASILWAFGAFEQS